MSKFHHHAIAVSLAAMGLSLLHASALAATSSAAAGLSRAEVRAHLKDARATNTMTPSGEMGDTAEVLAAREALYALQTDALQARHEPARRAASASLTLDELVAELQALDDRRDAVRSIVAED